MNRRRVLAIFEREWREIRKNRMIVTTMMLLPLVMVGLILVTAYFMEGTAEQEMRLTGFHPPPELAALGKKYAFIVLLNDQYMFYLLLIPMALPLTIAAYSIIGEKETRSLEPLLATPITTAELVIGKALAAVTPAVLLGWLSFALVAVGLFLVSREPVVAHVLRALWIVGMLVVSPLLAVLSTLIAVIASSRINDVRAAQGVAALVILPVIGGGVAVLVSQTYLDVGILLWGTAGLCLLNAVLLWLAIRVFQRETILTRWK